MGFWGSFSHKNVSYIKKDVLINNKFERFWNVTDEISAKLLSSFLECEVLVVIPDRYGFEFSIKGAERKHIQEIEILDNWKVPKLPWVFEW